MCYHIRLDLREQADSPPGFLSIVRFGKVWVVHGEAIGRLGIVFRHLAFQYVDDEILSSLSPVYEPFRYAQFEDDPFRFRSVSGQRPFVHTDAKPRRTLFQFTSLTISGVTRLDFLIVAIGVRDDLNILMLPLSRQ